MTENEHRQFYELCQTYRHTPLHRFIEVREAYDALVSFVDSVRTSREVYITLERDGFQKRLRLSEFDRITAVDALQRLVDLKAHKDQFGKTGTYTALQASAWAQARGALKSQSMEVDYEKKET